MRARLLGSLLILILSGCLTAPPEGDGSTGQDDPGALPALEVPQILEMGDCTIQEILFSAVPETLEAYLPEGFTAEPFPAEGGSALIALGMHCTEPEETRLAVLIIPVVGVPDGWGRENASAQGVITSILVDEGATTLATLGAWGYGPTLATGSVRLEDAAPSAPEPLPRIGKTTAETSAGQRFVLDTVVRGTPRIDEGNFLRFFMVHDDKVIGVWDCDLTGNHRIYSAEAHLDASGYAPLPDGLSAGLGFHERSDLFRWTRLEVPPSP
ncbi:MAG TPA: hypothetical protein VNZ52_08815 [Candidatus Thermoplasmatota archaeon]|nr:hypothetical protein [Candidatus Thermoplasmatota archaeon]